MANSNAEYDDHPSAEGVALTLYVQAPVAGVRAVTIDRLNDLTVAGEIAGFDVETVRDEVILSEGGDARRPTATPPRIEALVAWRGAALHPALDVRTVSTRMGRTVRKAELPEMTLAVYEDGDLVCVFPCTDGDHTWTVTDFLDRYEGGDGLPPGAGRVLSAV